MNKQTFTITLPHDFNGLELIKHLNNLSAKLKSWKHIGPAGGNPTITIELPESNIDKAKEIFQF